MNEGLADLQDRLVKMHTKLRDRLAKETDDAKAEALLNEMTEVTHRVQMVGALLFTAQSAALDKQLAKIVKATKKVNAAIAGIKKLQAFLDTVSDFLALVDEAIQLAKALP